MKGSIGDNARLKHIMEYIMEIETALEGGSFESFLDNHILRIAVVKWLEIIGEAANHVSNETKEKLDGIEWNKIIGLRNIVIHEYFRIDFAIIWDAATIYLKDLKTKLEAIKLDLNNDFLTN